VALQTNILLGVGLLFVFSFGMGTLLIIVGTFTGLITSLPKSGNWMEKINYVFGFVLLGAGEYFLYIAGTLSY
jgi:thiol:disulfide interchange protein DsbD